MCIRRQQSRVIAIFWQTGWVHTLQNNQKTWLLFKEDHLLGSVYPSEGEQDEHKFNCVGQYIAYRKSMLFGDKETAEDILQTGVI